MLPSASPSTVATLNLRRPGARRWFGPTLLVALVAVAVLLGLAIYLRGGGGRSARRSSAPTPALRADAGVPARPAAHPDAGTARSLDPCPRGMQLVAGSPGVCIDTFEAPGEGFTPATNVTLEQARRACLERGRRLCTASEWERACRGVNGASYPWGDRYAADRCNLRGGGHATLAPSGSFKACVSESGAFDMSGNAAEWVQESQVRGGSAGDGHDGRCSRIERRAPEQAAGDVGYRCCIAPGAY